MSSSPVFIVHVAGGEWGMVGPDGTGGSNHQGILKLVLIAGHQKISADWILV
jgi:hypothetical protein